MKTNSNRIAAWVASLIAAVALAAPVQAHDHDMNMGGEKQPSGTVQTLTGEVVDLMCYLDHGAVGEKHRECAATCIQSGGPVGLLVGDKVYLVIGDHKPINDRLSPLAAQTVTLKGKVVERAGMRMIENVEIVKK